MRQSGSAILFPLCEFSENPQPSHKSTHMRHSSVSQTVPSSELIHQHCRSPCCLLLPANKPIQMHTRELLTETLSHKYIHMRAHRLRRFIIHSTLKLLYLPYTDVSPTKHPPPIPYQKTNVLTFKVTIPFACASASSRLCRGSFTPTPSGPRRRR